MLVSPAPSNATLPSLWSKMKKGGKNDNALTARMRTLTLACGDKETVKVLPPSYADLEAVAKDWAKPAPGAPFSLRIPVQYASLQASRFIHGEYVYLHDEDSYQIAIMGIHGLYVEVISETPPPDDPPPPPPPPPVLEMPATFNLEIAPGKLIAIDTICESDELDMSRTEDGTLVAGMFMGKLDIVHDHDAKIHKMEFTGTRLKDESYSPEFFFDSRTMGKLVIAAKPSIAKCHISVLSPDQQYCDIELKLSPFWRLGNTWPPVESLGPNAAKFFLRVNPGGAMEHFESEAVVTSLYYEAMPEPSAIDPASMIGPHNGFAMAVPQFIPHLYKILDNLGLKPAARTNFINAQIPYFFQYKNIAYRFMTPERLNQAIELKVTCSPCIWTRIFLLYRGISDEELALFSSAGEKDVHEGHWKNLLKIQEQSTNKEFFRILETSILEIC